MTSPEWPNRLEAAFLGALLGDNAVPGASVACELFAVAESITVVAGFDVDELRFRGLGIAPAAGPVAVALRALPFGWLTPPDRGRAREHARACAGLSGTDELGIAVAMVITTLASDLLFYDTEVSLRRCRQTYIEAVPTSILDALQPNAARAQLTSDPVLILSAVVTSLSLFQGVVQVVDALAPLHSPVASSLGGALAGTRDGMTPVDRARLEGLAHVSGTVALAHRFWAVAGGFDRVQTSAIDH